MSSLDGNNSAVDPSAQESGPEESLENHASDQPNQSAPSDQDSAQNSGEPSIIESSFLNTLEPLNSTPLAVGQSFTKPSIAVVLPITLSISAIAFSIWGTPSALNDATFTPKVLQWLKTLWFGYFFIAIVGIAFVLGPKKTRGTLGVFLLFPTVLSIFLGLQLPGVIDSRQVHQYSVMLCRSSAIAQDSSCGSGYEPYLEDNLNIITPKRSHAWTEMTDYMPMPLSEVAGSSSSLGSKGIMTLGQVINIQKSFNDTITLVLSPLPGGVAFGPGDHIKTAEFDVMYVGADINDGRIFCTLKSSTDFQTSDFVAVKFMPVAVTMDYQDNHAMGITTALCSSALILK